VFGISWLFFKTYDILFGIRVSPQTELAGLDVPELGVLAYPPDAEPSLQPAAAGIANSIPAVAWQQPQLDSINQQPLPQSLRVTPPPQNQGGRINPNYQERPVNRTTSGNVPIRTTRKDLSTRTIRKDPPIRASLEKMFSPRPGGKAREIDHAVSLLIQISSEAGGKSYAFQHFYWLCRL